MICFYGNYASAEDSGSRQAHCSVCQKVAAMLTKYFIKHIQKNYMKRTANQEQRGTEWITKINKRGFSYALSICI